MFGNLCDARREVAVLELGDIDWRASYKITRSGGTRCPPTGELLVLTNQQEFQCHSPFVTAEQCAPATVALLPSRVVHPVIDLTIQIVGSVGTAIDFTSTWPNWNVSTSSRPRSPPTARRGPPDSDSLPPDP